MNNSLPMCNFCDNNQAEWEFVYGSEPTLNYAFCCTLHIPNLILSKSNGNNGDVKLGYLMKWNANQKYNPVWNKSWREFFIEANKPSK